MVTATNRNSWIAWILADANALTPASSKTLSPATRKHCCGEADRRRKERSLNLGGLAIQYRQSG
jgi:hypothetical protein